MGINDQNKAARRGTSRMLCPGCCWTAVLLLHAVFSTSADATTADEMTEITLRWGESEQDEENQTYVRIGAPAPLVLGDRSPTVDRQVVQAYKLFFRLLHERTGGIQINGKAAPVELTLVDDQGSPEGVRKATEYLVYSKNVSLLLAPYGSGHLLRPAADVAHDSSSVLMVHSLPDPTLLVGRPQLFGMLGMHGTTGSVLPVLRDRGAKTMAYVAEESDVLQDVCAKIAEQATQGGMQFSGHSVVPAAATRAEIGAALQELQPLETDILLGCVHRQVCHQMINELVELDFNPKALVLTMCVTQPDFLGAVKEAGQFVMGTASWDPGVGWQSASLPGLGATEFFDEYTKAYDGMLPVPAAAAAFAAAEVLFQGVQLANSTDAQKVAAAMATMDLETIYGRVDFSQSRGVRMTQRLLQHQMSAFPFVVGPEDDFAEQTLVYPKPGWKETRCLSQVTAIDNHGKVVRLNMSRAEKLTQPCGPCPPGLVSRFDFDLRVRICVACGGGLEAAQSPDSDGQVSCVDCGEGFFKAASSENPFCEVCPPGTHQTKRGQRQCAQCPPGKFSASQGAIECSVCQQFPASDGRPSYNSLWGQTSCKPCPVNGICEERDGLFVDFTNKDGYAILIAPGKHLDESSLLKCAHGGGEACRARGQCYKDPETGEEAMEGPMCGRCRKGFGRISQQGVCRKCPETMAKLFLGWLSQATLLALCTAAVCLLDAGTNYQTLRNSETVIMRQIYHWAHMAAVVFSATSLPLPFGKDTQYLATWLGFLSGLSPKAAGYHANDCAAQMVFPGKPFYQVQPVMGAMGMPLWLAMTYFFFRFLDCFTAWFVGRPHRRPTVTTLVLIPLYIIQPRITVITFGPLACHHFDEPRLWLDTEVKCLSSSYRDSALVSALANFTVSVGLPAVFGVILWYHKQRGDLQDAAVLRKIGFLCSGFNRRGYYFEVVFMVRSVIFLIVGAMPGMSSADPTSDSAIRTSLLFLLTSFFLALHFLIMPFDRSGYFQLEKVEGAALIALFGTSLIQTYVFVTMRDNLIARFELRLQLASAVAVMLHLRFLWFACWGLVRNTIREQSRLAILDHGCIEVTKDGLRVVNLSYKARGLMHYIFVELVQRHVHRGAILSYEGLVAALQRAAVQAYYHRVLEKKAAQRDLGQSSADAFTTWFARIFRLEEEAVERLQYSVRRKLRRAKQTLQRSHDVFSRGLVFILRPSSSPLTEYQGDNQRIEEDLDILRRFSHDAVCRTYGEYFTVDELYLALLALGDKEVCDLALPPAEERPPLQKKSKALSPAISPREPRMKPLSPRMVTGTLDSEHVLMTELRAERRRCAALEEQLGELREQPPPDASVASSRLASSRLEAAALEAMSVNRAASRAPGAGGVEISVKRSRDSRDLIQVISYDDEDDGDETDAVQPGLQSNVSLTFWGAHSVKLRSSSDTSHISSGTLSLEIRSARTTSTS
eukprot:TRINITY_DN29902_c0_g1_i1.p1 TRINITY_DN29902_c0_g1~~TRINITY_DN29902_c0_g1_i1.p1  ORF type:complete len:1454 (-),score=266.92 TRINITY_DN29902_c0_g1_i1:647-5008(-)